MKTHPNDPAAPFFQHNEAGYGDAIVFHQADGSKVILPFTPGMSKREEFAKAAMQGILASSADRGTRAVAVLAVEMADALILQLNCTATTD